MAGRCSSTPSRQSFPLLGEFQVLRRPRWSNGRHRPLPRGNRQFLGSVHRSTKGSTTGAARRDENSAGFHDRAVFSQDGRLIATASDRTARVWDAATREPVGPSMLHDDPVVGIGFDPQARVVATASGSKVHFWDVASGTRDGQPLALDQPVTGVAYSPDGKRLAACGGDTAWLWDPATRKPVGMPMKHSQPTRTVAFSPDSASVYSQMKRMQPVSGTRTLGDQSARLIHGRTGSAAEGTAAFHSVPAASCLPRPAIRRGSGTWPAGKTSRVEFAIGGALCRLEPRRQASHDCTHGGVARPVGVRSRPRAAEFLPSY